MLKVNLTPYYTELKTNKANELNALYNELDTIVSPYMTRQIRQEVILYHGTNNRSAKKIISEGFKIIQKKKHAKLTKSLGELGPALYFTPFKHVANLFGSNIIEVKSIMTNPAKVTAQNWEEFSKKVIILLQSCRNNHKNKSTANRTNSLLFNEIIKDYMSEKNIDALYCNDFTSNNYRNLNLLKQRQWGIFSPNNLTIINVTKKSIPHYLLRFRLRAKQLIKIPDFLSNKN